METDDDKPGRPADEVVVFSVVRDATCAECGEELFSGSFIRMEKERPHCLACADLGHLVFLPRGNTALTRRSRKASTLSAVVVRFSRARGRYERQGVLVEPAALAQAEAECLADREIRERARARAAETREKLDLVYVAEFSTRIPTQYPGCPAEAATRIAEHACERYSGRVGRSAMAKEFDPSAIALAVRAFIRHEHTNYDQLLHRGVERAEARTAVAAQVDKWEARWRDRG